MKHPRISKLSVQAVSFALVSLATLLCVSSARAQSSGIQHQITTHPLSPAAMGRDFWWAMPSNFWGENLGGKYMRIYITSPKNTTAFVQLSVQGAQTPVPVQAYKISTFQIPQSWEMESSGIVEEKAIHVWSKDADLTVYFMSHNQATSDGTYIIPTIGWGTDYVVAGYAALFEATADYPSEFTIAAEADNTIVQITPSCDLRRSTGQSNGAVIAYPAGVAFADTLNRGQSVQFMSVTATGTDGFDVTGTILHSNYPIGVIGGSMCPNIPLEFPYCDHVEHMLPPVRTWGRTYYSSYFTQPAGRQGHDFGLYLFISSKDSQVIWQSNAQTGTQQECQISNKYGVYWDEKEQAQKFFSDAPFLLVEYMNSSSYPDNQNGYGDPAEVVIPVRESYSKDVLFTVPANAGGQQPYDNYATVIVNVGDASVTRFDGKPILTYISQPIDDTFKIFTIPHITPGAHVVTGDSVGVGVYVYGYGFDESYAWSGPLGTGTFAPKDTTPPVATISGSCTLAYVHLGDAGRTSYGVPQSKLSLIRVDSSSNMTFTIDSNWQEGLGLDTSGYKVSVVDPTKTAYIQVDAFDVAGNETSIVNTYTPGSVVTLTPAQLDAGLVPLNATRYLYDTIVNVGTESATISELTLVHGNVGFSLDSGLLPPTIPAGEQRVIKIGFTPTKSSSVTDTLVVAVGCGTQTAALVGVGGSADFIVPNQTWLNETLPAPASGYLKAVEVQNLSPVPITIDSAWWPDTIHFRAYDTVPFSVPASGGMLFRIAYFPDDSSKLRPDETVGHWTSPQVLAADNKTRSVRTDTLSGSAQDLGVAGETVAGFEVSAIPDPVTGLSVSFQITLPESSRITVTVYDALGHEVGRAADGTSYARGVWQVPFDVSRLANGTYTCRVSAEGATGLIVRERQFVVQR